MEFRDIPKVDLHCHLDGGLRVNTLIQLAKKEGIALPSEDLAELQRFFKNQAMSANLAKYLELFKFTTAVMQSEDSLYRIAYEAVADLHADGVYLAELRFAPELHTNKGLTPAAIMDATMAGLTDASTKFGISTGIIVCAIRNLEPSTYAAEIAAEYLGKGVIGFDLAGNEVGNLPAKFSKSFSICREAKVPITIHGGEAAGEASILSALAQGANRIGHATSMRSAELLQEVKTAKVTLEVCVTSNLDTRACRVVEEHPVDFFLKNGVSVVPCTDNRLMSHTTLSQEYALLANTFGYGLPEFRQFFHYGISSSFLPETARENARLKGDNKFGTFKT